VLVFNEKQQREKEDQLVTYSGPEALELYRKRPSVKGDTIVLCEGAFDTAA